MKVVVEVHETVYEHYRDLCQCQDGGELSIAIKAIGDGVPLPEKHGRLVDIGEYEDNYFNTAITYDDGNHIHEKYTNMIPTIIEAEGR